MIGQSLDASIGMCGWVLRNERSLLFGESTPFLMDTKTVWEKSRQSAVLVPLFARKKIIGGVSALGKKGGGSFSRHELDLLTVFANQVSTAVETAGLFRKLEKELNERTLAENSYKHLSNQHKLILNSAGEGIYGLDINGQVSFINPAAAKMLGWEVDELIGRHSHTTWHYAKADGKPRAAEECVLCSVLGSDTGVTVLDDVFQSKAGTSFPVEYTGTPIIEHGDHVGRVVVFKDISAFRQAEIEKIKLEEQLRHAQKMESIGTLAGGIAHDFNNILSAIIGYGNLALMMMAKDDPRRQNIEYMLDAGDRAAHLTKDLLLFSRKQICERKPIDLNNIIRKMEKFLMRVIGEDVECRSSLISGVLPVLGDAHQLEQVLMNLATNARDAMPTGGVFSITTDQVKFDSEFVSVHGYGKPGNYVLITISDTGMGMDGATRAHIFEPFFTTKEVGKGTGLGLSVAYGMIRQHEGFLNVYSEPGLGTTFNIYLPLISERLEEECRLVEDQPMGGTETILLAEDDETVRNMTRTLLEQFGYTVITAIDGQDAVSIYRENKDAIDLLLFDLVMPKKTGKQAYDEILSMTPGVKVIFSSGYAPDMVRQKVFLEDGIPMVNKPVSPITLLKQVRSVLDQVNQPARARY